MSTVLAALDATAAASRVLGTAVAIGRRLHLDVHALHVGCAEQAPTAIAATAGVPLTVVHGHPVSMIIKVSEPSDVMLVALALHGLPGRHEAGQTALSVAAQLAKPVLVVPPEEPVRDTVRRILVPLDGTRGVSAGVRSLIATCQAAAIEVIAVHIFDAHTVPRFHDGPQDAAVWREEFLAQHCAETGVRLKTSPGPTAPALLRIADADDVDVIALGWRQNLAPARARIVRQLLTHSHRPIALVPLPDPTQRSDPER